MCGCRGCRGHVSRIVCSNKHIGDISSPLDPDMSFARFQIKGLPKPNEEDDEVTLL